MFMILTGCRVGEACGLCWDAVDIRFKLARIVCSISWDHYTREPRLLDSVKSADSVRLLPLASELVELLQSMAGEGDSAKGLVFRNSRGQPLRYNAIQSAFNAGFMALGLPWRSTHICRHTHATMMMLATNGNLSAVQASLGHRSRSVTERYAKAVAALDASGAEKTALMIGLGD